MSVGEWVILLGAVSALIGSVLVSAANYRNSVKRSDFDELKDDLDRSKARIVDTEARLAQTESRANSAERRADEYRQDVQQLGRAIERERAISNRNLAIVAQDAESKIDKMLLVIENLYAAIEAATGKPPDVDMAVLRKMMVLDHITGPLGPIDLLSRDSREAR